MYYIMGVPQRHTTKENKNETARRVPKIPAGKQEENKMKINTMLSEKRCWDMVNRIQLAKTPAEIRERCKIAEEWLTKNEVIDNDQYDDMMRAVAYMCRESYHQEAQSRMRW